MRQIASLPYTRGAGYQAVELPYDGHEISMVILLPDPGEFEAFEQRLDRNLLTSILDSVGYQEIDLTMPRFEIRTEFSLPDALSAMGMPDAFSQAADFSGIDGTQDLMISDVIHQAFVSVDEAGTEAAAATAILMGESLPAEPLQLRLDRPFLFLIRDVETGAVLFLGRTLNPAES
jgi:serpin B